jgi:PAS domain-containing protein
MNVQQVPQPSDIASLNAGVYTQLIKSQPFLSLNPYTALPQHEMIKTSENISCATTSIDAPSIKKGVGHFASSTSDKKHRLSEEEEDSDSHSNVMSTEEKRCNKRAANRLSAQLSRRRRKVFMEELKEENEKLRRKESILNSIPDLVVVFDSAGKIGFVSKSVCTMLKFTADELHGSSFWDRLSDDSERLVKAAFMDSLAAKCESSETVPLGQGIWEIQIIDKDLSLKHVTLHGVVHFLGENPQCVCTIRPQDHSSTLNTVYTADTNKNGLVKKISSISSSSKESSRKDGGSVDMVTLSGETGEVIESVMSKEIRSSRILSSGTVQISDIESVID